LFCRFEYRTIDRIHDVKTPVYIVHGSADYKIPVGHSYKLLEKAIRSQHFCDFDFSSKSKKITSSHHNDTTAQFPIQVQIIPSAGHENSHQFLPWIQGISAFIRHIEE
jgi:fermentation-respiration switch protein FrsA (DUF1100 family)